MRIVWWDPHAKILQPSLFPLRCEKLSHGRCSVGPNLPGQSMKRTKSHRSLLCKCKEAVRGWVSGITKLRIAPKDVSTASSSSDLSLEAFFGSRRDESHSTSRNGLGAGCVMCSTVYCKSDMSDTYLDFWYMQRHVVSYYLGYVRFKQNVFSKSNPNCI